MKKLEVVSLGAFLVFFFLFLFQAYFKRIGAFGCFDDCFNYVAGYFMLKGKILYSQIFFTHQPLMAVLSSTIQAFLHPQTIYQLVAYHRAFILLFGFLMDTILVLRFRWAGLGFVIFYETTKFYLFGDRFLGEALITYLLIYLFGLFWESRRGKNIRSIEVFLAAFSTWLIIFTREAFMPIAFFLFILILFYTKASRIFPMAIFFFLTLITLSRLPLEDYFFNVVRANFSNLGGETAANKLLGIGALKIFAYPFYIFLGGQQNYFRHILIGLGSIFLILASFWSFKFRKIRPIILLLLILALANLRFVEPGKVFYGAFHMAPWYGLFIFITCLLLVETAKKKPKIIFYSGLAILVTTLSYIILSPQWFPKEKIDKDGEFTTSYGNDFVQGQVVKLLAKPGDTLFLDGWDDLIYWQADLPSAYKYSWYTSDMPFYPVYVKAREEMFQKYPPVFYYGNCAKKLPRYLLPTFRENDYRPLYFSGKPTCLNIIKSKIPGIDKNKWEEIKKLGFYLP